MSKKAIVNYKRGWSDDYIQYDFALFSGKDAQKGQLCYLLQSSWKRIVPTK